MIGHQVKVIYYAMSLFLLPQHEVVAVCVFWLTRVTIQLLDVAEVGLVGDLVHMLLPSLHHYISKRFLLLYWRVTRTAFTA